jgi:peptide chain release factor 2
LRQEQERFDQVMAAPDFWSDPQKAREVIAQANRVKRWTGPIAALETLYEEVELFEQMAGEEGSSDAEAEAQAARQKAAHALEKLEDEFMLGGADDEKGAMVEIHPGAGGTESQDWADMLLRMYTRYCEASGWKHEVLDVQPGEEAGIKSATLEIGEPYAYGYLKGESGVHRLVRISPFDAQARRHTSFASVFVYPLIEDQDFDIQVLDSELRVDTYRASGAGGQHVNKTSSAVRITHIPTGIVVQCQNERSQHRNRELAMRVLHAKLYHRRMEEEKAKHAVLEQSKMKIDFGSQIRSYVLQPYTKVKDHRTDVEVGDAQRVLDGGIDPFIQSFLRAAGRAV